MRILTFMCLLILCLSGQFSFAFKDRSSSNPHTQLLMREDVNAFIGMMVKKHHFNRQNLNELFKQVKIHPQIIKSMNKPLESQPWDTYQVLFISEWRIEHGVKFWNKHADLLKKAEKKFGVPAAIIVATLGIETKYGKRIGGHRVIDSLSNLAFNHPSRGGFFKKELEAFLILTRKFHLRPLKVMGSYAGAIGMPQFMPSSYLKYAINFSDQGKNRSHVASPSDMVDLMNNEAAVIGSVANYYHQHGWAKQQPVAVRAYMIGKRYNFLIKNTNQAMTLAELSKYGVIPKYKASADNTLAKVITLPRHYHHEYWLGFHNFDVIKRYNSSNLYAMAVYQLSNYITELREKLNNV